eukprot:12781812-Alexandrium_andersonii.AAC.1
MLDLPFELAHALGRGCAAQGLGSIAALPEVIWRHRDGTGDVADLPLLFPQDADRPLLHALGLGPEG